MSDLISRRAAIALADKLKDDLPDDERIADGVIAHNEGILEYQTELSLLPSAEKTGRWIRITQGADPEKYICPFCHRTVDDYGPDCMVSIRYPYCHCGARMVEE